MLNKPIFSRFRQLPPAKFEAAKLEFAMLLKAGIVRHSNSSYASPLHMVIKKNNQCRPCGDYRQLNSVTKPNRYPLPRISDVTSRHGNKSIFSNLDLVKANYNVPIHPDDIPKTAVTTPFGLFEFTRMPFGLRNATQTFQRFMDTIFQDLPFVCVYVLTTFK